MSVRRRDPGGHGGGRGRGGGGGAGGAEEEPGPRLGARAGRRPGQYLRAIAAKVGGDSPNATRVRVFRTGGGAPRGSPVGF